jgi:UDP-glucose 4-epimerase
LTEKEKTVGFDISPDTRRIGDFLDHLKLVQGDVADVEAVIHAIREHGVDTIFHLASLLTLDSETNPWRALKTNVDGTVNILEASRLCNVDKVIFPSTRAVFGPRDLTPLNDDDAMRPNSVYGVTKMLCEHYGLKYFSLYGLDFRSARLDMVYGPGRNTGRSSFGTQLIEYPALGRPVKIRYSPEETTDWLYVKDAVRALRLIRDATTLKRRIYNMNGERRSLGEVADIVRKNVPNAVIEFEPGNIKLSQIYPLMDDGEARKDLGWSPEFTVEDGVIDHIREILRE